MLFIFLSLISSFDLQKIFEGAWDAEVSDMNQDGSIKTTDYYGFNLSISNDPETLSALLFKGDFVPVETATNSKEKEALLEFEINIHPEHEGKIEVNGEMLTEFSFVESFPNFLVSYGKLDANLSYAVNIINLATIHISLFSMPQTAFREIILTKYKPPESSIPWYERYYNYLFGLFVFIITFIALHFFDPIMNALGFKGNSKQIFEKDKKVEKKKEKKKK